MGSPFHPRPDQRHIKPADVDGIVELLRAYPGAELNIEGNPFIDTNADRRARRRPTQATLVPDTPEALTSDHGWQLDAEAARLGPIIARLKALGARVSLFIGSRARRDGAARRRWAPIGSSSTPSPTPPRFARGDRDAAEPYQRGGGERAPRRGSR